MTAPSTTWRTVTGSSGCVGLGPTAWPGTSQAGSLPTASWAGASRPNHAGAASYDGPSAPGAASSLDTRGLLALLAQPIVVLAAGHAVCPTRRDAFAARFPISVCAFKAQLESPQEAPRISGPQLRSPLPSLIPCTFPDSSRGALNYRGKARPLGDPICTESPLCPGALRRGADKEHMGPGWGLGLRPH